MLDLVEHKDLFLVLQLQQTILVKVQLLVNFAYQHKVREICYLVCGKLPMPVRLCG